MADYEMLRLVWWLILGALLIGFAITDGYDLGIGTMFRFLGRTDDDRRVLLESIEPTWEGHQVWFIVGGGAAFAAWPLLYAASFSGLYLALFMVLVALILRPVGFAFRGKLTTSAWRNAWDWALFVGGAVPAFLFGVAFGNLFLGISFHFDELQRPIFTGSFVAHLHPFALLAGVVSLAMLVMHGAAWAAFKVDRLLASRAAVVGQVAAIVFVVTFLVAGMWLALGLDGQRVVSQVDTAAASNPILKTVEVTLGGWLANYRAHPVLWLAPGVTMLSALLTMLLLRMRRSGLAFLTSALAQTGTILTAGIALFPFLMPSSAAPNHGLTVWDASSSQKTLLIMLLGVVLFLPIVLSYTAWVFRVLRGEITLEKIRRHTGFY